MFNDFRQLGIVSSLDTFAFEAVCHFEIEARLYTNQRRRLRHTTHQWWLQSSNPSGDLGSVWCQWPTSGVLLDNLATHLSCTDFCNVVLARTRYFLRRSEWNRNSLVAKHYQVSLFMCWLLYSVCGELVHCLGNIQPTDGQTFQLFHWPSAKEIGLDDRID